MSKPLAWTLVVASGALTSGLVALGCGGSTEAPKSGQATQVAWHQGEDKEAEAPTADREPQSTGTEIDLDALEAQPKQGSGKAAPAATQVAKVKEEPKPKQKTEAEPPAEEPPAAPEVEQAVEEPPAPPATVAVVPLGKEMRAAVKGDQKEPPPQKAPKQKPAAAVAAAPAYTGPNPCTTAHFKVPRVEEACANGGRSAAKGVMKDAIGKALASGASLKCATCHADLQNFTLKKDAVAELKKWLGP